MILSSIESYGLVALEAASLSIPIIALPYPWLVELVSNFYELDFYGANYIPCFKQLEYDYNRTLLRVPRMTFRPRSTSSS